MTRLTRTVRHLSPVQVVHRLRLRTNARLRRSFPRAAARWARRRAGPPPPVRDLPNLLVGLSRPCPRSVIERRAEEVAGGRFTFLGITRELGAAPFPAPPDVPLLWAYHLEYMDYLLDLVLAGESGAVGPLVTSRLGAESGAAATHPYTDSRRAAAWCRVLGLHPEVARGVWTWANRVARNLEWDVGGNHLLENGLALVLAGARFEGRRARRLLDAGWRILLEGARSQVLPDGAHYELSPMYHARVLQLLTEGAAAVEQRGVRVPGEYWETLARMAGFLGGVLRSDGTIPLVGDSARDPGLTPPAFLALVTEELPFAPRWPAPGDRSYPHAGLYVFEERERGRRLLLDAGPTCPPRLPAHGQADTFSFELDAGGVGLVVDAGLHGYQGAMRGWCRATRAHSTVEVDGEDSSEVWASFRVGRRARVEDAVWSVRDGLGTFSGRHDGYRHLGVSHARTVSHLEDGLWLVADSLVGDGPHDFVSRLHLHPGTVVEQAPGGAIRVHRAGEVLTVVPFGPVRTGWEEGWHCPELGVRRPSRLFRMRARGSSALMGYALALGRGPRPEVRVDGGMIEVRRGGREHARGAHSRGTHSRGAHSRGAHSRGMP